MDRFDFILIITRLGEAQALRACASRNGVINFGAPGLPTYAAAGVYKRQDLLAPQVKTLPKGNSVQKISKMYWAVLAFLSLALIPASAQTSVVDFPTLPDGATWVEGLTTIFVSAAGLGLGILGLRLVIRMIRKGLAKG